MHCALSLSLPSIFTISRNCWKTFPIRKDSTALSGSIYIFYIFSLFLFYIFISSLFSTPASPSLSFRLSLALCQYLSDSPKNRNSLIKVLEQQAEDPFCHYLFIWSQDQITATAQERSQLPSQRCSHIHKALACLAPTSPACQIFPFGSCVHHTRRWVWWVILLFDGIITANTPSFHSRSHICKVKKMAKFRRHQWKPKVAEVTRLKLDMSNEWLPGKTMQVLRTGAGNKRQISLLCSRSCLHVCLIHCP